MCILNAEQLKIRFFKLSNGKPTSRFVLDKDFQTAYSRSRQTTVSESRLKYLWLTDKLKQL